MKKIGIIIYLMLAVLLAPTVAYANLVTIEAVGSYSQDTALQESSEAAKDRARYEARQNALEKAGVIVESNALSTNSKLTLDELKVITGQIIEVKDEEITTEPDGDKVKFVCKLVVVVDTSTILKKAHDLQTSNLEEAVNIEKKLAEITKQNDELKAKYQALTDNAAKSKLQEEIFSNEKEFQLRRIEEQVVELSLKRQYDEEISLLTKAIAEYGEYDWLYHAMGAAYYAKGDYLKAAANLGRAVQLNPHEEGHYLTLASISINSGLYQQALEYANTALSINPASSSAYNNRGNAYISLGKYDEALRDYKVSLSIQETAATYLNIANLYNVLGQYSQAVEYAQKGLLLAPDNDAAYNNLAVAYAGLGKVDEAIANYQKAISLNPYNYEAKINLANNYISLGKNSEALQLLNEVQGQVGYSTSLFITKATIYMNMKDFQEAIKCYENVLVLGNLSGTALSNVYKDRGGAYALLGDYQRAESDIKKALAISDNPYAHQVLSFIYAKQKKYSDALSEINSAISLANEPIFLEFKAMLEKESRQG